jgi:uncharacterized protein YhbP (UPF0306 family)
MHDYMNVEQVIRDYIAEVIHMSLASCRDNKPWVCELHFAYDEKLNLYFRSKPSRRHSAEISANPHVAGNIISEHKVGDDVRGVYFEGRAELLENVGEEHPAYKLYCERFETGPEILEEAREEDGHKFYKIAVSTFYLFDGRQSTPSQKYVLPWNKLTNE